MEKNWNKYWVDFINKHSDKLDWGELSLNSNITMELIEKYPDKEWCWYAISVRRDLNFEFVSKYPDKPWDWEVLSEVRNFDFTWVEKFPDKDWNWKYLSRWASKNKKSSIYRESMMPLGQLVTLAQFMVKSFN